MCAPAGVSVQEIASTADALEFLLDWTDDRHDIRAETLLRACYDVEAGRKTVSTVEQGLEHFARRHDLLEQEHPKMPWMGVATGGGGRAPI